jgi:hypothetical protein
MNDPESAVRREHVGYWQRLLEVGAALVFGPVRDASGSWGLAIVE